MKNLKLFAAVSVLAVFLAAGSVVYGGLSWTGMDPVIRLSDGTIVNVDIAVPPESWCLIDGPIDVQIAAPAGATLIDEQYGPCGVTTVTELVVGVDGILLVTAKPVTFTKKDNFPIEVMISVNGVEQATCTGQSKRGVSCEINLDDDEDDRVQSKGKGKDRRKR